MEIVFHGAVNEVGRSCVEVRTKKTRFLLDSGMKIVAEPPEPTGEEAIPTGIPKPEEKYPTKIKDLDKIDVVFLSHAHLDHSGALPYLFHSRMNAPIITTRMTKSLSRLLLLDSYKIDKLKFGRADYGKDNIKDVMRSIQNTRFRKKYYFNDITYQFFDAGHIPGSASILFEAENKRIVYSGDIKIDQTRLMNGADTNYKDIDVLITESTYGNREHKDRKETEKQFLEDIETTISNGGDVLIPVFAVGRAQEIMLLLKNKKFGVDIYLDGMAKKATRIILEDEEFIKNGNDLRNSLNRINIATPKNRKDIIKEQSIIITTSGMLNGGPIINYLKHIWYDKKNSLFLTGYQTEDSNGRLLLEKGVLYIDGTKIKPKCNYKKFDFSAHAGREELERYINKVNPKKIIFNHGEKDAILSLNEWAKSQGYNTIMPKLGKEIVIE